MNEKVQELFGSQRFQERFVRLSTKRQAVLLHHITTGVSDAWVDGFMTAMEHTASCSASHTGKKFSIETRNKMAVAHRARAAARKHQEGATSGEKQ